MKHFQYCLITDRTKYDQPLKKIAAEAEKAGVDYFQLREKDLSPRELFSLAQEIRPVLCRTRMIINGCLEVALACKADGVHLQKDNIPVASVRSKYKDLRIGYSAHSFEEMKEVQSQGADYVFISPIFEPISKTSNLQAHGLSALRVWTRKMGIPVFALGGVSAKNLSQLKEAGCAGAAGISLFMQDGIFTTSGMVI
jgi:thiamine-phosphate pyrophosphorylase